MKKLPETAAEEIIQIIIDDKYNEGDKLPTETEFMERLGVGRGTIREAIRILCARNITEVRQGAGSFVSAYNGVPADPFGFMFKRDSIKTVMDLMELRCIIEPHIAMLAAQNAEIEQLNELESACIGVESCILRGESHGIWDMKFHTTIAQCTQNSVISQLIPITNNSISIFIDMTDNRLTHETIQAHRGILEAIKHKNCTRAKEEMYLHLLTVRKAIELKIKD